MSLPFVFMMSFGRAMFRLRVDRRGFYLKVQESGCRWGKRIGYYRADSASYQAELFNQLEKDGVKYAITADQGQSGEGIDWVDQERGMEGTGERMWV